MFSIQLHLFSPSLICSDIHLFLLKFIDFLPAENGGEMEEGGWKRRMANFTLLPGCYHRSKHCKFSSILARTTFSRAFFFCHLCLLHFVLFCWLWVDGVWLFQNSYRWVGSSISSGLRKKPYLHRCDPSIKILRVIFNGYVHHAHSRVHL